MSLCCHDQRNREIERWFTPCCDVSVALISLLNWNRLLLLIMFNVRMVGLLATIPPSSFRHTYHFKEENKTVERGRELHYEQMKSANGTRGKRECSEGIKTGISKIKSEVTRWRVKDGGVLSEISDFKHIYN